MFLCNFNMFPEMLAAEIGLFDNLVIDVVILLKYLPNLQG